MECREAQAQLEFKSLGRDAASGPDAQAAQRHLAECEACHRAMDFQQRFDSEVGRAMSDIPIPAGLTDRLRSAVTSVTPQSSLQRAVRTRHTWRWVTSLTLALLLPLLGWAWFGPQAAGLNETSVRQLAEMERNSLPTDSQTPFAIPAGWNSLREIQLESSTHLASVNGIHVPLLGFLARADRGRPSTSGFLLRLNRNQWQSKLEATSFSSAMIQYDTFGTWVVWSEGDTVFVCVMHDDAHAIQRLQDLVAGSRDFS